MKTIQELLMQLMSDGNWQNSAVGPELITQIDAAATALEQGLADCRMLLKQSCNAQVKLQRENAELTKKLEAMPKIEAESQAARREWTANLEAMQKKLTDAQKELGIMRASLIILRRYCNRDIIGSMDPDKALMVEAAVAIAEQLEETK